MKNKKSNLHKKGRSRLKHRIKLTIQVIVLFMLLAILGVITYFYLNYGKTILQFQSEAKQLVQNSTEDTFKSTQTSIVYDADGNLISTLKAEKDVYYIKFADIPAFAINAMLVTEDRNFYEHDGVDYWANVRAAIELIKHKGHITQGASTITQQLAKNIFLSQEKTYERKIKEIFMAQELESKYTKDQIMEFYLNAIYYANGHYGIQSAAQAYFGEGVNSLSLSQIAFLCAIPNNPNLYNPLTNMDNTLKRRNRILKQMYDNGKIDAAQYQEALNETIKLKKNTSDTKDYVQSFVYNSAIKALMKEQGFEFKNEFASDKEKKEYDTEYNELYDSIQKELYTNGYRIYTSIDTNKQELLQKSLDEELKGFTEKTKDGVYKMQGSAVSIDNDTGRVVAVVGGRKQDLGSYSLNRAFQSYRQPGSSIKPLIAYTPALERGYTPNTIVNDVYKKDGPRNSNRKYLGKIKLQTALEKSINTIAWQLFEELTPKTGLSYLLRMNFNKIVKSDYVPAASLGGITYGVSTLEMASAYATLENEGYYREPTCIIKIIDPEGKVIVDDDIEPESVYDSKAAKIITEMMTGVIKNGTGRGLGLSHTISAGKTGTTTDKKDGWFCGYTPYYTTCVWVGYDSPKAVSDLVGSTYPGRIWHNYMEEIHTSSMTRKFEYYKWNKETKKDDTVTVTAAPTAVPTPDPNENTDNNTVATPTPEPDTTDDNDTTDDPDSYEDGGDDTTGDNQDNPEDTGDNTSTDQNSTGEDGKSTEGSSTTNQ